MQLLSGALGELRDGAQVVLDDALLGPDDVLKAIYRVLVHFVDLEEVLELGLQLLSSRLVLLQLHVTVDELLLCLGGSILVPELLVGSGRAQLRQVLSDGALTLVAKV